MADKDKNKDKDKDKKAGEDLPKKPRRKINMVTLLLVLVNLAAIGGGGTLVYMNTLGFIKPVLTEEDVYQEIKYQRQFSDNEPIIFKMDLFTVNINSPRYVINTEMNLEMLDEDGFEEVITTGPEVRDTIVNILSSKTLSELESIQGKLFLKDQIAVSINELLDKGVVKDVYFSSFVVQRR